MIAQETMDAELLALAALTFSEAVMVQTHNYDRQNRGYAPCYGEDWCSAYAPRLEELVKARGILK